MKISITLDEAKAGTKTARCTKTTTDLEFKARRQEPLVLSRPVELDGKRITLVIPTRFDRTADKKYELDFIPLWQRTWIVCEARSNKIRLIVLELPDRKLAFDSDGVRPCTFTTQGDGVGWEADENAEELLAKLISEDPWRAHVGDVIAFLSRSVAELRPAVAA